MRKTLFLPLLLFMMFLLTSNNICAQTTILKDTIYNLSTVTGNKQKLNTRTIREFNNSGQLVKSISYYSTGAFLSSYRCIYENNLIKYSIDSTISYNTITNNNYNSKGEFISSIKTNNYGSSFQSSSISTYENNLEKNRKDSTTSNYTLTNFNYNSNKDIILQTSSTYTLAGVLSSKDTISYIRVYDSKGRSTKIVSNTYSSAKTTLTNNIYNVNYIETSNYTCKYKDTTSCTFSSKSKTLLLPNGQKLLTSTPTYINDLDIFLDKFSVNSTDSKLNVISSINYNNDLSEYTLSKTYTDYTSSNLIVFNYPDTINKKNIVILNKLTISPPTASATQSFCASANPTIASLTATGMEIKWYATLTGGSALPSTTSLTTGTTYYASQTISGVESNNRFAVSVTITNATTPTGDASQSFCSINSPTVASLSATGTAIQWYTSASGGSALATTTALTAGANYYASQTINGCESSRLTVNITIANPAVPTGNTIQSFYTNNNPTIASLSATGTSIKWYASSSGGSALANTTALTNGTTYYASQTIDGCESSSRLAVAVTITNQTSVKKTISDSEINVFPNPAKDLLTITVNNLPNNDEIDLSILNNIGMIVLNKRVNISANSLNIILPISNIKPGIYQLFITQNKKSAIKKVVIF